jgi:hypothetical protein
MALNYIRFRGNADFARTVSPAAEACGRADTLREHATLRACHFQTIVMSLHLL